MGGRLKENIRRSMVTVALLGTSLTAFLAPAAAAPAQIGTSAVSQPLVAAAAAAATTDFVPLSPTRILDTRGSAKPAAGETVDLQVTGAGGVPASGVGAVVMNVTATRASAPGFVTVWPTGQPLPTASNLNIEHVDQTVPNLVIVPVGTNGKVSIYTQSGTDLIADVAGWYPTGSTFNPLSPTRILDTRGSAKPAAGETVDLQVTGAGGVPASGVGAVVMNVTATRASAPGFVTVWPTGQPLPTASNLNIEHVDQTVPNLVIVPVGTNGKVSIYTQSGTDLIADVAGWVPIQVGPDPSLVVVAAVGEVTPIGDEKGDGLLTLSYVGPRSVKVGTIFAIPPDSVREQGSYAEVTALLAGSTYQAKPQQLGDILPGAQFVFDVADPTSSANLRVKSANLAVALSDGSGLVPQSISGVGKPTYSCSGKATYNQSFDGTGPFFRKLHVDGRILTLDPWFELTAEVGVALKMSATMTAEGSCQGSVRLLDASADQKFTLGPVPVWVHHRVQIDLKGSASGTADASWQLSREYGSLVGFGYSDGSVHAIKGPLDKPDNSATFDAHGSFHGDVSLPIAYDVTVDSIATFGATLKPWLSVDAKANITPPTASAEVHSWVGVDLSLRAALRVKVKLPIIGERGWEKDWDLGNYQIIGPREVLNKKWDWAIASAPTTPNPATVVASKPELPNRPTPSTGPGYTITNTGGQGVPLRNSPRLSDIRSAGPNDGAAITILCQTFGEAAGIRNNHVWDDIIWAGHEGFIPDAFTSTPVRVDQFLTGVPRCPDPGVTVQAASTSPAGSVYAATNTGGQATFVTDSPSASAPRRTGPVAGDSFQLVCQAWGDPYGTFNNHLWDKIVWNGQQVFLPDTFATTPTVADQYVTGVTHCAGGDPPIVTQPPATGTTRAEQQGSRGANTFTDPHAISGAGPRVAPSQTVQVSCRLLDPSAPSISPDGYWYRLADSPWNNQYYAAANTFMNGDPPGGPFTHNTDFAVPDCNGAPPTPTTYTETQGSRGVNTFSNYHNASGPGTRVNPSQQVQVSCKVYDPTIASANPDGYWYRIASAPWSNAYYAPANTFMNGDPPGGPFTHNTDFAVPNC